MTGIGLIAGGARLEKLASGCEWAEGPLWLPELGRVRWSDIPNDRILEWDAATGRLSVFRDGVEYTNGRALDLDGRVVQCSHGRRAIEREGADGPETLVERWAEGRFNSPNDVAVASDGSIWFTDPPYGIDQSGREGHPGQLEYGGCYVFRFDPATGDVQPVVTDLVHPNGIGFSPDEGVLYVSDTGSLAGHEADTHIQSYPTDGVRVTGPGTHFAKVPTGVSDGFAIDEEGRLWTSAGDGVHVYTPAGRHLHHIRVPEVVSNVTFGGAEGRDLFLTATTSLYRIATLTVAAR